MRRPLMVEEVLDLRKQIVLNSLFISDYRNSLGVNAREACDFFDGFMEFIGELADEDGFDVTYATYNDFFKKYDTPENLESWFGCFTEWPLYAEEDEEKSCSN